MIKILDMIKRWELFLGFFMIFMIFFSGCTSEKAGGNLTKPMDNKSLSQSKQQMKSATNTPAVEEQTSWFMRMAQNETAYNRYPDNTSYNLSITCVTLKKGADSGNLSSYIATINITAKNGGPHPIELTIRGVELTADSGDGCVYTMPYWCSIVNFEKINPGESQTKTASVVFRSKKDFNYLSARKFFYDVEIGEEDLVSHSGWDGNRNSWIIDMNNST